MWDGRAAKKYSLILSSKLNGAHTMMSLNFTCSGTHQSSIDAGTTSKYRDTEPVTEAFGVCKVPS